MRIVKVMAVIIGLCLVVGCSSQPKKLAMRMEDPVSKELKDVYVSATTVKDSTDRSVTFDQLGVETDEKDENGNPVLRAIATQRTVGGTTVGRTIEGVVPGVATAATQGLFLKEVAKIKTNGYVKGMRCPDGSLVCHSTILQGAQAGASAGSTSDAKVIVDVVKQTGCSDCGSFMD